MSQARFRIGIDVGGTFTDIVLCDGADGTLALHKVPTTPHDIALGLLAALRKSGVPAAGIAEIAHGTTVATNAVLERKGARTGLLTTAGFRDVLELRDGRRRTLLGRQAAFEPLVPRQWRCEVPERLDASGTVLQPLSEEEVKAAAEALRRQGAESLAIAFLHADRNGVHERRVREILNGLWPNGHLILGSEVCPFPDERLRTATAVLAAYLTPLMARYVESLERGLRETGTAAPFRFIESAGGSCSPDEIRRHPLRTILSGPVGGATAGGCLADLLGLDAVATADMGGTSFDVAIIQDGQPELTGDRTLEFGMTVAVPSVAIHSAGIGGGSLVWMDETIPGGLQVGPQSAGGTPGPACFGKGGRKPTVTDANLLLGRLVRNRTDLGLPPLDSGPAHQAMLAEVCPGLGLDPVAAARVVLDVAEARMVGFLRTQLAARGKVPGRTALIAFGGAGPVQAASVARRLGVPSVIIPYLAAGFSALGALLSPPARTAMVPVEESLRTLTPERLRELIATAFSGRTRGTLRLALILRRGENPHEDMLPVRDPGEPADARVRRYHAFTETAYGIRPAPETVRVTRLLAILEEGNSHLELSQSLEATFAREQVRYAAAPGEMKTSGVNGTPQLPAESLKIGAKARGPALIVLPGASAFVPEGMAYHVDGWGNLILETGT
ncbi:MAG: hydantoinase/oxoprolinase family protein [candidate division NC10 bacterium]|nr:hydantoinase/oxoprolinase family protein [candidate division NC10 bacterium]MBI2113952.1 hydantoinase/oxoprolinase family protein [candidate division NC10 bacterium]MBI2456285.1 hydantoinase/oxoprolinase family protein [candidate division NC10 bacterium]